MKSERSVKTTLLRRQFLIQSAAATVTLISHPGQTDAASGQEMVLFDGRTLNGWHVNRQKIGHGTGGSWKVENGAISGAQDPPGNGGLLLTDEVFEDFELSLEINPDWGIDSGFFVRSTEDGKAFQIAIDYLPGGFVGQIYGEGLGGFNARSFGLKEVEGGNSGRLRLEAYALEPTPEIEFTYGISPEKWLSIWKIDDWNAVRVKVVGQLPHITAWINDEMTVDFSPQNYRHPKFDAAKVAELLPKAGHIALQVHGGERRWRAGAKSRWRNIRIRRLG